MGRVSTGQLPSLKSLQPSPSGLSTSRTFATKASTQQGKANKAVPWFLKTDKAPRTSSGKVPDVHHAASGQGGVHNKSAAASGKTSNSKSSYQQSASQNRNPVNRQGLSKADTSDSSRSADHDRRESSLSGNASTSGTKSSCAGTSRNKTYSGAARNSHRKTGQGALVSNGAAANKGSKTGSSSTSPAQSDGSSNLKRPAPPHAPSPVVLGDAAASESTDSFRVSNSSSVSSPPQQGSVNPNTASVGGAQHNPDSAATSSAEQVTASSGSAPQEPSMYAQKAVPFDVSASQKSGTTAIRDLLETQKITLQEYAPGQKPKILCPQCHGGSQHEASLAVNISVDSQSAAWLCHRATCGWQGAIDQKTGSCSYDI